MEQYHFKFLKKSKIIKKYLIDKIFNIKKINSKRDFFSVLTDFQKLNTNSKTEIRNIQKLNFQIKKNNYEEENNNKSNIIQNNYYKIINFQN
jgi:hypothetical protein